MADSYDLIVIGAGTGGYVAAIRAAQLGLKTVVVERQTPLGGTCLNWGCIPTKALLEHAHVLKLAQHAAEWGISTGGAPPAIDMTRVHARKNKIVSGLTRGVDFLFKKHRIERLIGTAQLAGGGQVRVTGEAPRTLSGREIVVATGSRPRGLSIAAFDGSRIISSDEAIHLAEVPQSLVVIGSGAVGVEMASIFNSFGSAVTLIEIMPRIVPAEDAAVSAELEKAFRQRGIVVQTATEVTGAEPGGAGVDLELTFGNGRRQTMHVDVVLVAVGRAPVTDGLGVEQAGLRLENGYIPVDSLLRTNVPGVSAIGDVISTGPTPHLQLAHVSSAEGILVAERLAGLEVRPLDYQNVPVCTYCDPEIAHAGLTEAEAVARGFAVETGTFPFSALGRARIAGETEGFVKIVGEKQYDQLLGVHVIGPRATELIAEAAVALRLEATVEELVRTMHAHPTLAEAIGEASHAVHGGAIHL
ncbi:MAG: dihydrolipoyl dehydrogenase [Vicinamibacterales bacterium]